MTIAIICSILGLWLVSFIIACVSADSSPTEQVIKESARRVDAIRDETRRRGFVLHEEAYRDGTELYIHPTYKKILDYKNESPKRNKNTVGYSKFVLEV